MKQATIIDVYSRGHYHEVINVAYLMMIASLYDRVTYIAADSACLTLRQMLASLSFDVSNITFHEKAFSEAEVKKVSANKFGERLKYSWLKYYYYMQQPAGTDVFYNNNLFLAITLLTWFSWGKKNRIFSLMHSEMEVINPAEAKRFSKKVSAWYFGQVFRHSRLPERFCFILLSDVMKQYFLRFTSPKNAARIQSIDHAYIRPDNPRRGTLSLPVSIRQQGVKIGLPSILNLDHGLDFFRQILETTSLSVVIFYAISLVSEPLHAENFVNLNRDGRLMAYDTYNAYLSCMDLLLFPYASNSYKLTASGAFLEAIWNGIPVIALHNQYFDSLFARFGEMGFLFDDKESLITFLSGIDTTQPTFQQKISTFRKNMATAKAALHPDQVRLQLANLL